jgi:hypothetical protein
MSSTVTITIPAEQFAALKGLLALTEPEAPAMPEGLKAAKQHCYAARMARREKTALGGLTKAERSALYAEHPELSAMSATARAKAWKAIVVAYKAS